MNDLFCQQSTCGLCVSHSKCVVVVVELETDVLVVVNLSVYERGMRLSTNPKQKRRASSVGRFIDLIE